MPTAPPRGRAARAAQSLLPPYMQSETTNDGSVKNGPRVSCYPPNDLFGLLRSQMQIDPTLSSPFLSSHLFLSTLSLFCWQKVSCVRITRNMRTRPTTFLSFFAHLFSFWEYFQSGTKTRESWLDLGMSPLLKLRANSHSPGKFTVLLDNP